MNEKNFKDFSEMLVELSSLTEKMAAHAIESNEGTMDHARFIQSLHAARRGCADLADELSCDLVKRQSERFRKKTNETQVIELPKPLSIGDSSEENQPQGI